MASVTSSPDDFFDLDIETHICAEFGEDVFSDSADFETLEHLLRLKAQKGGEPASDTPDQAQLFRENNSARTRSLISAIIAYDRVVFDCGMGEGHRLLDSIDNAKKVAKWSSSRGSLPLLSKGVLSWGGCRHMLIGNELMEGCIIDYLDEGGVVVFSVANKMVDMVKVRNRYYFVSHGLFYFKPFQPLLKLGLAQWIGYMLPMLKDGSPLAARLPEGVRRRLRLPLVFSCPA